MRVKTHHLTGDFPKKKRFVFFPDLCEYGSIPINTIFRGMNIHLPAILMFTRGTRFWPIPMWVYHSLPRSGNTWSSHLFGSAVSHPLPRGHSHCPSSEHHQGLRWDLCLAERRDCDLVKIPTGWCPVVSWFRSLDYIIFRYLYIYIL